MANATLDPPKANDEQQPTALPWQQPEDYTNDFYQASARRHMAEAENNAANDAQQQTQPAADRATREQNGRYTANSPQRRAKSKNPLNPRAVKGVRGWILGMIVTGLLGVALPIGGFMSDFLPSIGNLLGNHSPYRITAESQRAGMVLRDKLFSTPKLCGAGQLIILCKLQNRGVGLSDRQIGRLKKLGLDIKTTKWEDQFGKSYNVLDQMKYNGEQIIPDNFLEFYNKSIGFRAKMWAAKSPINAFVYRSAASVAKLGWLGIKRGAGVLLDGLQKFRDYFYAGGGKNQPLEEPTSGDEADNVKKQLQDQADSAINDAAQAEAENATTNGPKVMQGDPNTLEGPAGPSMSDVAGGAKNIAQGVKGVLLGIFTAYSSACMVRAFLDTVTAGAKVLRLIALAKYAALFLSNADAIKTGTMKKDDGTVVEVNKADSVSYVTNLLMTPSTDPSTMGQTSADSNLLSYYVDDNKVQDPGLLAWMVIGNPGIDAMTNISQFLTSVGANKQGCKFALQWEVQLGMVAVNVIATVLTEGGAAALALVPGAVSQATFFSLMGILIKLLAPSLIQFIAGTIVPDAKNDPRHSLITGEALSAGNGSLTNQLDAASGMQPLTQQQAAAMQPEINQEMAMITQIQHMGKSPFGMDSSDSITSRLAYALLPYFAAPASQPNIQNVAALVLSPLSIVGNAVNQFFTKQVHAAVDTGSQYCKDEDVNIMQLNTDPYCNITMGLDKTTLNQYTTDQVDTYMATQENYLNILGGAAQQRTTGYLSDDGTPKADSDFEVFMRSCVTEVHPYTPEGNEGEVDGETINTNMCTGRNEQSSPENRLKLTMFRLYLMDSNLLASIDAADNGTLGQSQTANTLFSLGQ